MPEKYFGKNKFEILKKNYECHKYCGMAHLQTTNYG
jgi:hypothetical protein